MVFGTKSEFKQHHSKADHSRPKYTSDNNPKFQTLLNLMENGEAIYQISNNPEKFNYIWASRDIPKIKGDWDAHMDLFIALHSEKEQLIIIDNKYVARLSMCAKDDIGGQPRKLTIGYKEYMVATIIK